MYKECEKDWILEAINHLKRRKARPDFSRISLRMKRKHHFTFTQTRGLLDSLVESGFVVKAVYKNNTSYRDVSKWKRGRLGGQILNSSKMLRRFVNAIWANELENKGTGVSVKQIEQWFSGENEDKCFLSGAALRDAIENEVSNGYLGKLIVDNEAFYTVNNEKLKDLEDLTDDTTPVTTGKKSDMVPHSDSDQEDGSDIHSKSDLDNYLSNIVMAICETESEEGRGSSLLQIKHWLFENECVAFFQNSETETLLQEILADGVQKGVLNKSEGKEDLYVVNEQALDNDDSNFSDNLCLFNGSESDGRLINASQPQSSISKQSKSKSNKAVIKQNNQETRRLESAKSSKHSVAPVSLRPPSKRKRIMKDHGPDFEMELPTKSRKTAAETKESTYPTPVDSPISEKSETAIEQSFKFDFKKKRGRPKKKTNETEKTSTGEMFDADEGSRQGGPSEQSSICQEDDEASLDIPEIPFINVHSWTPQQVADYFSDKGYKEIAERMLGHEIDGAALGLLKRSDVVGCPGGGMLNIEKLGIALKLFRDIRNLLFLGNADNYSDPYEEKAFFRS